MKPIDALNRLSEIATGFFVSQAFATACSLRLFDHLAAGAATPDELATRLNLNIDACQRLLVMLSQLGLLERDAGRFRNSELGNFLTSHSKVPLEPLSMWSNPFHQRKRARGQLFREAVRRGQFPSHADRLRTWSEGEN